MTYKESLETAFRYADSERSDFDYPDMFHTLANEAQMLIATQGDKILREREIEVIGQSLSLADGEPAPFTQGSQRGYELMLPEDVYEVRNILDVRGNPVTFDTYERGVAIVPAPGTYKVIYYALPKVIDENTPDDYEYEVPLYTHVAIPYYIAYRLVGTDDTTLYQALKNQWNMYMGIFNQTGKARVKKIVNVYGI